MWSWTSNQGGEKRKQSQEDKSKHKTTKCKNTVQKKEALFFPTSYDPGFFIWDIENKSNYFLNQCIKILLWLCECVGSADEMTQTAGREGREESR